MFVCNCSVLKSNYGDHWISSEKRFNGDYDSYNFLFQTMKCALSKESHAYYKTKMHSVYLLKSCRELCTACQWLYLKSGGFLLFYIFLFYYFLNFILSLFSNNLVTIEFDSIELQSFISLC